MVFSIKKFVFFGAFLAFFVSTSLVFAVNTERVSVSSAGVEGNSTSAISSISSDGRYVAFQSSSTNLVAGDTNGTTDIFVYDRNTDSIERVSVSSAGVEGDNASSLPSISSDARFVTFTSSATNLVAGDTNGTTDIFVYDRNTDTIERVSVSSAGVEGDNGGGDYSYPSISSDGRYVAFESASTNLVAGDTNGAYDIFVYDRDTDTIERVSLDNFGIEGNSSNVLPSISSDGRYVAFESASTNLVAGDTNGTTDIFVYDRNTDTIERVSVSSAGVEGDNLSTFSPISSDGRYVAFQSSSTNLVAGDTNGTTDIFVYDRNTDSIERVSLDNFSIQGDDDSSRPSISSDGRYVAFQSESTNLVAGDTNGAFDVFVSEFNVFPSDITLTSSTINENENIGTVVGSLTTTDANTSDTHTYSLACTVPGADDASFNISGDNLVSADEFDYETKNSYAICIRTDDGQGGTYDENFTITIENVSESSSGSSSSSGPSNPPPPPPPPPDPTPTPVPPPDPITPPPVPEDPIEEPEPPVEEEIPAPEEEPPALPPEDTPPSAEEDGGENPFLGEVKSAIDDIGRGIQESFKEIPKEAADTVSIAGIALPAVFFVATQPAAAASIPLRLWNIVPTLLGFKRKKRPWGTVYDSITKQPLDPVYVTLSDMKGKEIATTITDLDGRFGFLVAPGMYTIAVHKDNYEFPSKKLVGQEHDELYNNLYFKETVQITNQDELLIKNVPMDALNFNWNEFEKAKNKKLMKFYSKRDLFLVNISAVAFYAGIISSVVLMFLAPAPLNYIVVGIYAVVMIMRALGIKPKKPGHVIEKETGFPLSFGIIKVFSAALGKEVAHAIIGKTGKYYILVPNGEYYMKISKKTGEDTYQEVFQSEVFSVKKGYVGKIFKI